ncbi:ThiS family protein [Corynebacterium cystitidis DSM 20524]|uniref:ThiS family protein n=2 Tax=Corynebacterium cystitidis TaxID=35757 RepID=A0A1H9U600_9CORY|nr:ThiS family protein [Corynebacterium cystitidis DSM 20524]SES05010.1 ThiS family protein [Corynebacterium cystitidis DSM 20524]SNV89474.1 molybdopterin biosynthesis protein MoaD2 [Corynebacterium cystitidis]
MQASIAIVGADMNIHYFAAARAAAGVDQESLGGTFSTLNDVLTHAAKLHSGTTDAGMTLAEVFERCTFLIDGCRAEGDASVAGATRVDVLPPFAGG